MRNFTLAIASFALVAASCATVSAQYITETIAGNGIPGNTGDGGSSRLAQISGPKDIALDAYENIYFTDRGNGTIRKISKLKGIITTIAGGGSSLADGVPALSASIHPNYMCISSAGDIYFTTDNQIRKIDAVTNTITTIAGTSAPGFGGDGGLAVSALLSNPQGIAIDASNNLYVVDHGNQRLRKITASTGFISTIAGNGTIGFTGDGGPAVSAVLSGPVCVAINATGDIFFSDQNPNYPNYDNSIIRKIDAVTGVVTHICGSTTYSGSTYGVLALNATLGTTTGLCFGNDGDMYCNEMSCSCRVLHFSSDTLDIVGGNFSIQSYTNDLAGPSSNMNIPYGLCVDHAGAVYVADSNNQRIRKIIKLSGTPTFAFGESQYIDPAVGVVYPLDSLLWVTDVDNGQTELWTIVTAPSHGTLFGFPAAQSSMSISTTSKPVSTSYTADLSYAGSDMFQIRVSDDVYSDVVTIYVGAYSVPLGNQIVNATQPTVSLFPNPASAVLNLGWAGIEKNNSRLVIRDVTNHIVYSRSLLGSNGSMQLNIGSFPAGMYFVNVGEITTKFVKE